MAGKERTGRDGIGNDGSGHAKRKGTGAGLYRGEGCYCRLRGARAECNTRTMELNENHHRADPHCSFGRWCRSLNNENLYGFICLLGTTLFCESPKSSATGLDTLWAKSVIRTDKSPKIKFHAAMKNSLLTLLAPARGRAEISRILWCGPQSIG